MGSFIRKIKLCTPQKSTAYPQISLGEGTGQGGEEKMHASKVWMMSGRYSSVSHIWEQAIGQNGHDHCKSAKFWIFNPLNKRACSLMLLGLIWLRAHSPAHGHVNPTPYGLRDCKYPDGKLDPAATWKRNSGHWICF